MPRLARRGSQAPRARRLIPRPSRRCRLRPRYARSALVSAPKVSDPPPSVCVMAGAVHSFEEPIVVDLFWSGQRRLPSAAASSREMVAAGLQWGQRRRAMDAAEEAEFILRLA